MEKVAINSSSLKHAILLIAAIGLVACGGLVLLNAGPRSVAWLSIISFGSMIPLFVWKILDSRPRLVFDEEGVYDRRLSVGTISWADISGAYIKEISGKSFVCLQIQDCEKYLGDLSPLRRRAVAADEELGVTPLSLDLSGIREEPGHILELVLKMAAAKNGLGACQASEKPLQPVDFRMRPTGYAGSEEPAVIPVKTIASP